MGDSVEIVFSASGCGTRSFWTFISVFLVIVAAVLFAKWLSQEGDVARTFPHRVDRLARYSIVAVVGLAIAVPTFAMAVGKSNTSLIASGNQIEVQGCVLARPFQSIFDRDEMSATLHYQRSKGRVIAALILRQHGQRTVRVGLGDSLVDRKLVKIVPEVMGLYAKWLTEDGESVPPYLNQYVH